MLPPFCCWSRLRRLQPRATARAARRRRSACSRRGTSSRCPGGHAGGSLRGRVAIYVSGGAALVLFVASLAMLDAERGHRDAGIQTFGDALWWAVTTVTTVGYGDRYPVTETGRFVAAGLMLAGIALLGVVTASFASWLIEKVQEVEEESHAATRHDVALLAAEVAALRDEIASSRPT